MDPTAEGVWNLETRQFEKTREINQDQRRHELTVAIIQRRHELTLAISEHLGGRALGGDAKVIGQWVKDVFDVIVTDDPNAETDKDVDTENTFGIGPEELAVENILGREDADPYLDRAGVGIKERVEFVVSEMRNIATRYLEEKGEKGQWLTATLSSGGARSTPWTSGPRWRPCDNRTPNRSASGPASP